MDPLAEEREWLSPYNFVQNNPINRIDPDGALDAPIYDESGDFLGTDDQGLQGKAIVMKKDDFTQGMSHDDALKKNLGAGGLKEGGMSKLSSHYSGLKDRPDYDGKLTFGEVTRWSNQGEGKPLFVDATKIDLSPLTTGDFKDNKSRSINFFKDQYQNLETGSVYGHIQVSLLNSQGAVRLGLESTLLDRHDFSNPTFKAINDWLYPGTPQDFNIFCAPCNSNIKVK